MANRRLSFWNRPGELACTALALLALAAGPARAQESLARLAPANAGLFVEVRGVEDLLVLATEPQLWAGLAEFAGQPADPSDAQEWRQRVMNTVRMEPAEAVRTLFSRRVAFVGSPESGSQDGVVLCEPDPARIRELLNSWNAREISNARGVAVYALQSGIALAVHQNILIFGDGAPVDGMFRAVLRAAQGGANCLADDATYRGLVKRVAQRPQGVCFLRIRPGSATTQVAGAATPAADLPGPLRGASAVLLALHRERSQLQITAIGDATPDAAPRAPRRSAALAATLPQKTLLAWAGHVDFMTLARGVNSLPERNVLRTAFKLQEPVVGSLLNGLDGDAAVAIGGVFPQQRLSGAPPMPAIAALLATRDGQRALDDCDALLQACATVFNFLALAGSRAQLPPRSTRQVGGVELRIQDLTQLASGPGREAVGELHVAWALDRDVLLLASHADWLEQIVRARHGQDPTLSESLGAAQRRFVANETVFVAASGPIADLGTRWLAYFEQHLPQLLAPEYWRRRQPGGNGTRLGIDVVEETQRQALRVRAVAPDLPAAALARTGDLIVGCDRARFATTQPVQEFRAALERRPNPRRVDLMIERDGRNLEVRVPIPYLDLVEQLRRAVALGQIAQRVVYVDESAEGGLPRGVLTIELRRSGETLFELAPTTQVQATGEERP